MLGVAAELALSCLPQADALNTDEIKSALIQCRDCSEVKMIQACLAIESAAKNGSVNPEVLFEVARKWNELHEERIGERDRPIQRWRPPANIGQFGIPGQQQQQQQGNQQQLNQHAFNQQAAPQMFGQQNHHHHGHQFAQGQAMAQVMANGQGMPNHHQGFPVHPYYPGMMNPYQPQPGPNYGNGNAAQGFQGQIQHHHHQPHPSSGVPFQFQPFYGPGGAVATTATAAAFVTTAASAAAAINPVHLRNMIQAGGQGQNNFFQSGAGQPMIVAAAVSQAAAIQSNVIRIQQQMQMAQAAAAAAAMAAGGQQAPVSYGHHHLVGAPVTVASPGGHFYHPIAGLAPQPFLAQPQQQRQPPQRVQHQPTPQLLPANPGNHGHSHDPYHQYLQRMVREVELYKRNLAMQNPSDSHLSMTPDQLGPLLSAYRVGLLGMETLSRRVHDDRPQVKYAKNPSYGDDVRWLMGIAMKLGTYQNVSRSSFADSNVLFFQVRNTFKSSVCVS